MIHLVSVNMVVSMISYLPCMLTPTNYVSESVRHRCIGPLCLATVFVRTCLSIKSFLLDVRISMVEVFLFYCPAVFVFVGIFNRM